MKKAESIRAAAELRAAIVTVLTNAGQALHNREIYAAELVAKLKRQRPRFDAILDAMHRSGKLERRGTPGDYVYDLPGRAPGAVATVPAPKRLQARGGRSVLPASPNRVELTIDRKSGELSGRTRGDIEFCVRFI